MPSWADTPMLVAGGWTSKFGGTEWRFDSKGVYIRTRRGGEKGPLRTGGATSTCQKIINLFQHHLITRSIEFNVPPELLIMTIATETGGYLEYGFTGLKTFRWEAHVGRFGCYSVGPMQTLASTAREVIRDLGLPYQPRDTFPEYTEEPRSPPTDHPGYDPEVNIHIGTAEIARRWALTGPNPILVSAAYNAGELAPARRRPFHRRNRWHLRTHKNHLDRAAKWFGDACALLKELRSE